MTETSGLTRTDALTSSRSVFKTAIEEASAWRKNLITLFSDGNPK